MVRREKPATRMMRPIHMRALIAVLVAAAVSGCAERAPRTHSGAPASISGESTVRVGQTIDFSMYTHCGVESTRINGRVWNAVDPLYASPERLGPPDGWGDPYQNGELTLESPDRAVFAALGQRVVLVPSETGEALRPCD